ncbi:MAG: LysR family transcriptional regulator [Lachnospiraceae bacterium]|nr:LysR family transcriptional regulator [Lachnospiraceae bacterium]
MLHPQIDTFLIVAEEGTFSKASEKMFLSKVSIMKQIDALENRIEIKLFDRTNHGVILTSAGQSFYQDIIKLRKNAQNAINRAKEIAGKETGIIRVGTSVLRSCKPLMDLWTEIDNGTYPFQIEIVPFNDNPSELNKAFDSLGKEIDMIVGSIGTEIQMVNHLFLPLKTFHCCIALSRKHPLSKKGRLTWADISGETMLLVKRGSTPILDAMRTEIETEHPDIYLIDIQNPYDVTVFNECERMGYIMETLDVWEEVHPSLVTLPMEWNYEIPCGIMYSNKASSAVRAFIEILKRHIGYQVLTQIQE